MHRARADRVRHIGIDDGENAFGRLFETEAEPLGQTADGAPRGGGVEPHGPAQEIIGVEPAEHDIGVGYGRLDAALAVGRWSGIGPGAARADAKGACAVDIGDRPAAGADSVDVDHRCKQRVTPNPRVAGGRLGKAAIDDDADIG